MKSHETRMVAPAFGAHNEEIKPLVQAGSSDSAALDAVVEALVRAGRSLPLVKTLLIPPAWSNKMAIPKSHQDLFSYCNCVMEPWDGPAGLVATDGHWVIGGMDRNGLRPMRYARTSDGLRGAGLGDRHGAARGGADRREGPGRPWRHDRRRPAGRQVLPRPRAEGPARRPEAVWPVGAEHHPSFRPRGAAAVRACPARARRAAPAAEPVRHHGRGSRAAAGADGGRRQGGGRLHGRRHAGRGALVALSRPAPLLPPAVLPGHQPADRFAARMAGDEPQDALRQPRQRLRRGAEPDHDPAAREPAAAEQRARGAEGALRPARHHDLLHLRRPCRARRAARRDRAHPGRGRGCGARGLRADRAERRGGVGEPGADPDDPGRRCRAQPPGAPGPAQLQLDHGALGRVPGRALCRGADRGRRYRGQPLAHRGGDRRPARAAACCRG